MKRCRGCNLVYSNRYSKCVCGRKLPQTVRPKHLAALEQPLEAFIAANDGYPGCWVCRDLGETNDRRLVRDHEHKGEGMPRGVLCDYHNRCLGPRYTPRLVLSLARYLNRGEAA